MPKLPTSLDVYWRYLGGADDSWTPVTLYLDKGAFSGLITPDPGLSVEVDHPLLGVKTIVADTAPRRTSLKFPSVEHLYGDTYSINVAPYFSGTNLVFSAFSDADGVVGGFNFNDSVLSYTVGDKNFIGTITIRATNAAGTVTGSYRYNIDAFAPGFDIIVLAGESNMIGRYGPIDLDIDDDVPDIRVLQYGFNSGIVTVASNPLDHVGETPDTVGLGMAFAKAMLPVLPSNRKILLVPVAAGGTAFGAGSFSATPFYWSAAGSGDVSAIARVDAAMTHGPGQNRLLGILWNQGESDFSETAGTYSAALDSLITRWRSSMTGASASTPFLVGQTLIGGARTSAQVTQAHAGTPGRVSFSAFVPSTGLVSGGDNINYNAASMRSFGKRYFETFQEAKDNISGVPGEVVDLAVSLTLTQATLTWSPPVSHAHPVLDYVVQYKLRTAFTWTTVSDGVSATTGATISGLSSGAVYDFRVAAVNIIGTGPFSNISSGATSTPSPPSAITDLNGVPANNSVGLSWTAPAANGSAILDYSAEYKQSTACAWNIFPDGVSTVPAVTVTGLTNGTEYNFRVRAINALGSGPDSNIFTAVANPPILYPPPVRNWIFGADNPSMVDMVALSPLVANGSPPTFPGPFVRVTSGFLNGCRSNWGALETTFTICCVVRFTTASNGVVFGNLSSTLGAGALWSAGAVNAIIRSNSTNQVIGMPSTVDWYFIAMSFALGVGGLDYLGSSTGGTVFPRALTGYNLNSAMNFGIGNLFFPAGFPQGFDYAQLIFFNTALTSTQLDAVYADSASQLSARSIVLF